MGCELSKIVRNPFKRKKLSTTETIRIEEPKKQRNEVGKTLLEHVEFWDEILDEEDFCYSDGIDDDNKEEKEKEVDDDDDVADDDDVYNKDRENDKDDEYNDENGDNNEEEDDDDNAVDDVNVEDFNGHGENDDDEDDQDKEEEGQPGNDEAAVVASSGDGLIQVKPAKSVQDNTGIKKITVSSSVHGSITGLTCESQLREGGCRIIKVKPKPQNEPGTSPKASSSSGEWSKNVLDKLLGKESPRNSSDTVLVGLASFLDKRMGPKAPIGKHETMWMQTSNFKVGGSSEKNSQYSNDLFQNQRKRLRERLAQKRALEAWKKGVQEKE